MALPTSIPVTALVTLPGSSSHRRSNNCGGLNHNRLLCSQTTLVPLISLLILFFYSRMKHFAIDYHFVYDLVQPSQLRVAHVSIGNQLADALTKSLSRPRLLFLCNKIGVISGTPS